MMCRFRKQTTQLTLNKRMFLALIGCIYLILFNCSKVAFWSGPADDTLEFENVDCSGDAKLN